MYLKLNRLGLALALIGLMSGAAQASPISSSSGDGGTKALECLFNGPGGAGGGAKCKGAGPGWITEGAPLDPNKDFITSGAWMIGSSDIINARIAIELAGNKHINTFGMYDLSNPNNCIELFSGSKSAGAKTTVEYNGDGNYSLGSKSYNLGGSLFGWYLGAKGHTFYSQASRNPNGSDQMVAFQGNGARKTDFFGKGSKPWLQNEWILAWEDIKYNSSDKDFNDFIVHVTSVAPVSVPEPATLVLMGLGLLGLGAATKRRKV